MTLQLRYAAHSETGLIRKNNQDSGLASPASARGGRRHGRRSSR